MILMKKLYNILHVIFLYIFLISIYFTSADMRCSCRKSGSGDKKENEGNNSECCCKRRKEFNSKSMHVIKKGDQILLDNLEKKSIDNNKKQMLKDRNLQKYKTGKVDNNLKEKNNIKIDFVNNVGNDEEMLHNTREKYMKLISNKYDFLVEKYEISIQLCKDVNIDTEFTSYYNLILNARNLEELEQRKKNR